ncbi:MAG: hypothetical protein ACRDD7_08675, partial [Peptostreptococcaceae bacterium]
GLEDDDIIVLSSDSEGNNHSPAHDYGLGFYNHDEKEITFDDEIDDFEPEEKEQFSSNDDLKRCIIMFPV